jgi:hypothetical protein
MAEAFDDAAVQVPAPSAGSSIITNPAGATLATSFIAPPTTILVLWEANQ